MKKKPAKRKTQPTASRRRTMLPPRSIPQHMKWKSWPIAVLVIAALIVMPFFYEVLNIATAYPLARLSMINPKNCSWIKQMPDGWLCEDNWNSEHRINIIKKGDSYLRLDIGEEGIECTPLVPITLFSTPSPSGLAVPNLCTDGDELMYQAKWEQDGWKFQLVGKGVSRQFFLSNLIRIGTDQYMKDLQAYEQR